MRFNNKFMLRNALISSLYRISPILLIILTLLNCIMNPEYHSFYLFFIIILLFPRNWIIKHFIAKSIYNFFKTETLPVLGIVKDLMMQIVIILF